MDLIIASLLAFLCASAIVYAGLTSFSPVLRGFILADYLKVDRTLKNIFYMDYDAKVFVSLKFIGSIVALLIGLFMMNSLVFGVFLASIIYLIPGYLLNRVVKSRRGRLEDQTADVMTAFSACIKSGMTLNEAIDEIATTMRAPISEEFQLIGDRIDRGETIISALRAADSRIQVPRLSLIFQSVIVSQERGGQLASLMDQLSESTREIQRVEERVKTETAGLVLSARIMVMMPVVICGLLYIADPEQVTMLFTTVVGNIILVVAIALDIGGFLIMQKLIDLDV
ncbi:type II secretion system F family protein [bacterium]|nr:type II secretion system F family protein [bacterium]